MSDQYTGRARITNKQTGATREGEVTVNGGAVFEFLEDGTHVSNNNLHANFTIEPILPEIPSEPGDTFTAEVTRDRETKRVMLMKRPGDRWASSEYVGGSDLHDAMHIDRATIESVITAKERGL